MTGEWVLDCLTFFPLGAIVFSILAFLLGMMTAIALFGERK